MLAQVVRYIARSVRLTQSSSVDYRRRYERARDVDRCSNRWLQVTVGNIRGSEHISRCSKEKNAPRRVENTMQIDFRFQSARVDSRNFHSNDETKRVSKTDKLGPGSPLKPMAEANLQKQRRVKVGPTPICETWQNRRDGRSARNR